MRFCLYHLLIVISLVAIALISIDWYSRRSVIVEFRNPQTPNGAVLQGLSSQLGENEYSLEFTIQYSDRPRDGWVTTKFGYNAVLGIEVTPSNLGEFQGFERKLSYRRFSIMGLPMTRVEERMNKYFRAMCIFRRIDKWHVDTLWL